MGTGGATADDEAARAPKVPPVSLTTQIELLKKKQAEMVADRKRVKQVLRNAERKRRRLKEKAKALTDDDLLAVMRLREERKQDIIAANDGCRNESASIGARASDRDHEEATLGNAQSERVDEEEQQHAESEKEQT